MHRISFRLRRFALVLGDFTVYQLALLLTLAVRYRGVRESVWNLHALPFGIIGLLWVMSFYVAGLYDLTIARNNLKFFRLYLEGMLVNLAIAFTFFYLIPVFGIAPRTNLFLHFVFSLLLGYGWRLFYNRTLGNMWFKNKLLFIGTGNEIPKIKHLLEKTSYGFQLVAVLQTDMDEQTENSSLARYTSLEQLPMIIDTHKIQTILLGHRPEDIPGLRDALYKTLFTSVTLLDRAALEEILTGRVPLEYVSQTWFLEHVRENEKAWYESFKRICDVILVIPVGIIALVLSPFIFLLIKIFSPGSIFYSQIRIGKMGKPFRIWKLRTMKQDAEAEGRPQWASKGDPRITKIGAFLRAARLDELPQIWNVLRGDMSLIGPRPERPEFVQELTKQMPYYALRHLTRPGLTGWAQVKFPYAGTVEDNLKKLQYDLYYIKHRSPLLDLAILLKTIGIVLRRQGT